MSAPTPPSGSTLAEDPDGGRQKESSVQQYCLRWNNYQTNLTAVFDQLLQKESFVDVTLTTDEGHAVKCHKVVLSACSSYFASLLADNPSRHPVSLSLNHRSIGLQLGFIC